MKKLEINTTNGTKNYQLTPRDGGFNILRTAGFFGGSKLIGHGSSLQNAIFLARLDAGDTTVRSVKLKG